MTPRVVNLTFHGIGEPRRPLEEGESDVWVTEADFEGILSSVADRANVRVTFDDGNVSDVEIALPALRRLDITAQFFVLAGKLGQPGYLAGGDLRTLAAAGMGVGSHGMDHRPWRSAAPSDLEHEVIDARAMLEEAVSAPVRAVACPFGSYDRAVLRRLRDAGYERVYTSDRGWARPGAWLQPRNTIRADADLGAVRRLIDHDHRLGPELVTTMKQAVKRWR